MPSNTTRSTEQLLLSLQKQISQLSSQLADAQREIKALKSLLNDQTPQPELSVPVSTTTSSPLPPWQDPAKITNIKTPPTKVNHKHRARKAESAARLFQPPTPNQGFSFIYFHLKTRLPIGKLRTKLKTLGINNGRILDIHYPSTNTVAFLVHFDYILEFQQHLAKFKIFPDNDFNPYEGDYLNDPNLKKLSKEDKDSEAIRIHQERCLRTIIKLKGPVQRAVANSFLATGDISDDLWEVYMNTCVFPSPNGMQTD